MSNLPELPSAIGEIPSLGRLSAPELLVWAFTTHQDRVAFASSFGAEDVVVIDLIARHVPGFRIFTLDTGRLPEETYDVMERVRKRYGIRLEITFPERTAVETLLREKGAFSFRESVENRKECCFLRKVTPLRGMLVGLDAWATGLRREQSLTRGHLEQVEWDETYGLLKLNPLADWSEKQVWTYIKEHDVPYNRLHDRGFPSIGCAPCTRAIRPGEDVRAGRWWWESPDTKECGLHAAGDNDSGDGGGEAP